MAAEPITLFSRVVDPAGVARRLRELAPQVGFDGPDDRWSKAVVTLGRWPRKRTLRISHDPAYYAEPSWSRQMDGMRGYFSRFPATPRRERVLSLTTTFHFSLGTVFEPDFDPDGDERLDIVFAIAEHLDGVLFTPGTLRDARGRILISGGGEADEDPEAAWPRVLGEVSIDSPLGAALHETSRPRPPEDDGGLATAPAASRVARRALALTAVTARAILEQDGASPRSAKTHRDLAEWVRNIGIQEELAPEERTTLERPPGKLSEREQIDATWRIEGLVVLAWALGRHALPPHDVLVDPDALWQDLGFLDVETARSLLSCPVLKSRQEIGALRNALFAVHWRLRDYHVNRRVMDFASFARTCGFGPLSIEGLPLVDGDLAVCGARLDRASPDAFSSAHSASQERHQAANWLWEGPASYADASVAT